MNLQELRWYLCMECDEGKWYEYINEDEFTIEQCSCWKESWYSLIKGYIRIRIKILKKKLIWRNENVNENTF
tara:strand:- start:48 stop:263 length:216 start_codon:yes stop_codon:yes gene_type:complete